MLDLMETTLLEMFLKLELLLLLLLLYLWLLYLWLLWLLLLLYGNGGSEVVDVVGDVVLELSSSKMKRANNMVKLLLAKLPVSVARRA